MIENIDSPKDLKLLSVSQLEELAKEIRNRIIDVMSLNGGHLASNLGAVELTLALHTVFDAPRDKLIWDVSHQTYTHKIVTGRRDRFHTIRQYKGLCGFSHPKESQYDHFHAGHAGTALSLALGVAKNRDLTKRNEYIIPIIGDATLTCGVPLEALNNIRRSLKKFVVILNDNAMSISKNVGCMTQILSRMLSNPTLHRIHQDLDSLVSKLPYGETLSEQGRKISGSLKNLVSPAAFFEQFGLSYIGPVDGHNVGKLIDTLNGIKDSNWPVIVHVLTQKGKGMEEAVNDPVCYHGAKPFDKVTGKFHKPVKNKPTFPKVFGKHILEMAEKDPSVVAITPAMSHGSSLDDFMEKFPERCIDVGIAEGHAVTFSGGIAYGKKMKVVSCIYATFLQRAFDNLFHDVCLQEVPVVFAIDRAGISGPDGGTHHGIYDLSFLNAMPNMVITQPRNGQVLRELLESAFSFGRPTAIRYPNMGTEVSDALLQKRELGKGEILAEGKEYLLVGLGHMNELALQVRELLKSFGIEATVLDPIFVKPLDGELICDLLLTHDKVITIEEHSTVCGLGSILNNFLMTQGYQNVQVLNFGVPETFLEHGSNQEMLNEIGLTPEKMTQKIVGHFSIKKLNPLRSL